MFPGVAFLKGGVLSGFWQKGDPEISSVIARYGVVQDWQAVMQWRLSVMSRASPDRTEPARVMPCALSGGR